MDEYMTKMRVVTTSVPPYSIWIEGDNPVKSKDSRCDDHGPVSKKLLVGVAEYRIWPPWRLGKLNNTPLAVLMVPSTEEDHQDNVDMDKDVTEVNIDPSTQKRYRSRSYWPN
jgi:hypothetical protein